ncbi:hypothetical protein KCP73_21760 [Salmonella enterica subsp. enterica]|nr:hypothetical protein KCP73_21760 [Salmonella enterica subsp. enterica]
MMQRLLRISAANRYSRGGTSRSRRHNWVTAADSGSTLAITTRREMTVAQWQRSLSDLRRRRSKIQKYESSVAAAKC